MVYIHTSGPKPLYAEGEKRSNKVVDMQHKELAQDSIWHELQDVSCQSHRTRVQYLMLMDNIPT